FRAFDDDGATGANGSTYFADGLVVRKIPWGKCSADADRFSNNHLTDVGLARWDDASVDATALFCVPIGMISAAFNLANGFMQRFTLVQGDVATNLLGLVATHLRDFAQDF